MSDASEATGGEAPQEDAPDPRVELKLHLEGDQESLRRHQLSLVQFGEALRHLATAIRRCADAEVRGRIPSGGAYSRDAQRIDVRLTGLEGGSVTPVLEISEDWVDRSSNATGIEALGLFMEEDTTLSTADAELEQAGEFVTDRDLSLPERALRRTLHELGNASRGVVRFPAVRQMLQSMPDDVDHSYQAYVSGQLVGSVSLRGRLKLDSVVDRPKMVVVFGSVVAVNRRAGEGGIGVEIRTVEGVRMKWSARPETAKKAAHYFVANESVNFLGAIGADGDGRLVAIRRDTASLESSIAPSVPRILHEWEDTLRELS
ncbi:MAG: hypothetical protein AAGI22_29010 [Planctomycetota bacterium]